MPLVVLTADRPPELREVGAGQTIDQVKLYGSAAKWFFEVGTHDATPERHALDADARLPRGLDGARGSPRPGAPELRAARAARAARRARPDRSAARPRGGRPWVAALDAGRGRRGRRARARGRRARRAPARSSWRDARSRGSTRSRAACERLGWPLLADPLSGARRGGAAVAHYDLLLRSPAFAAAQRPDLVVRCGDLPTSKPLRAWLDGLGDDVTQLAFDPQSSWQDPAGALHAALAADPATTLVARAGTRRARTRPGLQAWRAADARAAGAIDGVLGDELSEPRVARELGARLPAGATLFVASSMPVRDVEGYVAVRADAPRVLCNRGANGIDGTVSSAFGAAAVATGRSSLLIGDVALAHDVGGLLAARRTGWR